MCKNVSVNNFLHEVQRVIGHISDKSALNREVAVVSHMKVNEELNPYRGQGFELTPY